MRKFGFDKAGVSIGTSVAMAKAKRECLNHGLYFVTDQRTGAAIGHLCELMGEMEEQIAELRAQLEGAPREVEATKQASVPAIDLPEHLRVPYPKMNGEQRQQLKAWKAQHAA